MSRLCTHAQKAQHIIQHLEQSCYTYVEEQLAQLVHWPLCETSKNQALAARQENLILGLQQEFRAMANYENKLVFPAVLKIMGLAGKNKAALHPNLPELFNLIHKKEQKIYQYLEQLNSSLDYEDQSPALAHIRNKLRTISDKFKESKMEWHHHIEESVMSCSCFNQYLNHSAFVERC